MTDRHARTRRRNFSPRMHRLAGGGPDGRDRAIRTHAAIPTHPSGIAAIAIGTEDDCLRCNDRILLTLTGWEHQP